MFIYIHIKTCISPTVYHSYGRFWNGNW